MSSTNQGPEYFAAEKKYFAAETLEEKIFYLKEMMRNFKKHKGSEKMLAELRTRLKKLVEKQDKAKKSSKGKKGIKKEHFQCVLLGLPNSGKSSLLSRLTNAKPKISSYAFTTTYPEIGTMDYQGVKAQIIDIPSIGSENLDQGLINTADCLLITIENLSDLEKIKLYTERAYGKKIIIINKSDLLSHEQLRKLEATISSKKLQAIIISALTGYNLEKLKEEIFEKMNVIRVYTKEPGKPKSNIPVILPENSTVKKVAESILKGFSSKIKTAHVTGPSSKFPNQRVGLAHVCKDLDIIEFHTK